MTLLIFKAIHFGSLEKGNGKNIVDCWSKALSRYFNTLFPAISERMCQRIILPCRWRNML